MATDLVQVGVSSDPDDIKSAGLAQFNDQLAAAGFPGWNGTEDVPEVILLGVFAQLLADYYAVGLTVSNAVLRALGTKLFGIPYASGVPATASSVWTLTGPAPVGGYVIEGGWAVLIDGSAFYVANSISVAAGQDTVTVPLVASSVGASFNGLGSAGATSPDVQLNQTVDWMSYITLSSATSGGVDEMSDDAYQAELAQVFPLLSARPVVGPDFATLLSSPLCESQTGVSVGRAVSLNGAYPDGRVLSTGGALGPITLSCSLTTGVATVTINPTSVSETAVPNPGTQITGTGVSAGALVGTVLSESQFTMVSATGAALPATATGTEMLTLTGAGQNATTGYGPQHLTAVGSITSGSATATITTPPYPYAVPDVGARVTGTGVAAGSTVTASPTITGFTLTANASATETGETLTFSSYTQVERCTTTWVTDDNGLALSPLEMDVLTAWLVGGTVSAPWLNDGAPTTFDPQVDWSFLAFVVAPEYQPIYIDAQVHVDPSYASAAAVVADVQSALLTALSPATWASSTVNGSTSWVLSGSNTIRYNVILGIIANVPGVAYVADNGLTLGTSPGPTGTADITLSGGSAPLLPLVTDSSIQITAV